MSTFLTSILEFTIMICSLDLGQYVGDLILASFIVATAQHKFPIEVNIYILTSQKTSQNKASNRVLSVASSHPRTIHKY